MEKLAEVLLKLESNDAVEVANKYITFKYVEFFTEIFIVVGLVIGIAFGIKYFIKNM